MSKIISFLKKHPELLTIPLGFIVWIMSIFVLRYLDPTSAVFDAGVFQIPIFASIQFFIYLSIAWVMLGVIFGTFKKYLKDKMKSDFKELSPWQRIRLSYSVFFFLTGLLAYLSRTLVTG